MIFVLNDCVLNPDENAFDGLGSEDVGGCPRVTPPVPRPGEPIRDKLLDWRMKKPSSPTLMVSKPR